MSAHLIQTERGPRRTPDNRDHEGQTVTISLVLLQPLVSLIAGILILMVPRLLHIIVGIYLIAIGVLGLWPHFMHQ